MDFNDGSQYRVVTDPARHIEERELYCFRAASTRDGTMYVDTAFERHRNDLASMRGLVMYQYVYVSASPEETADFFLAAIDGLRENEMVMVDPEVGGGFTNENAPAWVQQWLDRVEAALDTRAWVYVPSALAAGLDRRFTDRRIVMAPRYSGTELRGDAPSWSWDVHQYTDRGYFPGCPDPAGGDVSYTNMTVDDMLRRCNPNGIPVPPVHGPGGAIDG